MVQLKDRQIIIDGKARLLFSGELAYFRLRRGDWEDRVQKAKAMGCNTIATYIPWMVHEAREGDFDLSGRLAPENDLGAFIDLVHRHGLYFIGRPGPFVMSELKHEGIPGWVYKNYPDVVPQSWSDVKRITTATVQYNSPDFLKLAERWYSRVMPVLASRLQPNGGPVVGVQLDNEIGMLSWVSNEPDLGEDTLCQFTAWLQAKYPGGELEKRYPFPIGDPFARKKAMQDPADGFAGAFYQDYEHFRRAYIASYVSHLRGFAEKAGISGVPFIINIHGSGGDRGLQFPIGIHHLFEAYSQDGSYLPGSDQYLGELSRQNASDLYVMNAFMKAAARPDQPTSSMEFEVGTGDYGENGAVRLSNSAADFKVRLCLAQGNRMINYYTLAGGHNPHLRDKADDGNDRISFTGERHGFAAPIGPKGDLDPVYYGLQRTTRAMLEHADDLAQADEEWDNVALAFVPDYYATDMHHGDPMTKIVSGLEAYREVVDNLSRMMLELGLRFPAVDIQRSNLDPNVAIFYAGARYLDELTQKKLANYVDAGGHLLVVFEMPVMDLEGKPCTILADTLGLRPTEFYESSPEWTLAVQASDWASFEPEVSRWQVRSYSDPGSGVCMRIVGNGKPCGVEVTHGSGKAVVLGTNYANHMKFYRELFRRLGVEPGITHNDATSGLVVTTAKTAGGKRFFTALNLDMDPKAVRFWEHGEPMFHGRSLEFAGKEGKLIPI
jgi:beta-galactosidase